MDVSISSMARIVVVGMMVCLFGGAAALADSPIPISSLEDLQKIGKDPGYPLNGHYELTGDIDASASQEMNGGRGWTPIGTWNYVEREIFCQSCNVSNYHTILYSGSFSGTLDGKGHTIRGLRISNHADGYIPVISAIEVVSVGLFGAMDGAAVRDLSIEVDTIIADVVAGGHLYTGIFIGILAGISRNSVITNCSISGTLDYPFGFGGIPLVGGLVGRSESDTISNCNSEVTIGGRGKSAGGLAGESYGTVITDSNAEVTWADGASFTNIGDLAGTTSVIPSRHGSHRQSASLARFVKVSGNTLHLNMSDRGSVAIYALNGARVRAFDLAGGTHALRLNNLPRGTYIVKAQSGAWNRSARVLVK